MYKILAVDLDGTLLNSRKEIPAKNLESLLEAQEKGLIVVIASGRSTPGTMHIAKELQLEKFGGFIMAFNGGMITNCKTDEILFQKLLPLDILPKVYEFSKTGDFQITSYKDNRIICEDIDNKYIQYLSFANRMEARQTDDFIKTVNYPVPKYLIVGDPEPLHELELKMCKAFEGKLNICRSDPFLLEVLPYEINKGYSLKILLDKLNLKREELIACGDGFNDRSMVEYAGLGVAMENAQQEVKEVADYIAKSNEECGIEEVVRKFILS